MAKAYSQTEKSRAARTLALVLAVSWLLRYYVAPYIAGKTLSFLTSYLSFLSIGIALFRTMRIRGWSYKWVIRAHAVWIVVAFCTTAVHLFIILMVHKAPLAKAYVNSRDVPEDIANDIMAPSRLANKDKIYFIAREFLLMAIAALAGFSYIVWSCISVGRSRHDYGIPSEVPSDADSAYTSSYELREVHE